MKDSFPVSRVIFITCEKCGEGFEVRGSYNPSLYLMRLKSAKCPHCGHVKDEDYIQQYFKCQDAPEGCGTIFRKTRNFRERDGKCPACYMRKLRGQQAGGNLPSSQHEKHRGKEDRQGRSIPRNGGTKR